MALALNPLASRLTGVRWQDLCNRQERLLPGDDPASRLCAWQDSSLLTVASVFPRVGGRLLAHCLREWPVTLSTEPLPAVERPLLSVILPVAGADRLGQFLATVRSFLGQSERCIEIIVVEHAETPIYHQHCPAPVRHVHLSRAPGAQFNKSAAMNAGVQRAQGDAVLLHDADVVVPHGYAASILSRLQAGWEAVRPVRLLFLFDEAVSERFIRDGCLPRAVAAIEQNNPGLSTAVRRDVYTAIGGHDQRFEGWGGEDNEFLDRLQTRKLFRGAYAPAIHLWHPVAPKRANGDRNAAMTAALRRLPPEKRIAQLLAALPAGRMGARTRS